MLEKTCPPHTSCRLEQDRNWSTQDQRNTKLDALLSRWGGRLDAQDQQICELKTALVVDRNESQRNHTLLRESLETTRAYRQKNEQVLQELALSICSAREAAEKNHAVLLSAVTSNTLVAGSAVAQANAAADRADHARTFVAVSEGRLTKLTKAVLASWVLAIAAIGTLLTHFFMDVGGRWVQWLFSRA